MRNPVFFLIAAAVGAAVFLIARLIGNDYLFFAGYTVLQFIVLATAWNILGGYCGYVNFGSAAFFAVGAYSTVALHKLGTNVDRYAAESIAPLLHAIMPFSIPTLTVIAGVVAALIGFGMGYLTLRLRGAFFAIATLALAVVLQTLIVNWDYVGGSRGAYIIRPQEVPIIGSYIQYLFLLMIALAVIALTVARTIERSRLGYGFATIRDDELAAEACGVPTLKLKLIATTISGGLMGMAGASFPYYIGYLEPSSAFGLAYAVNSIAMPMIGGTTMWAGPLIGALLLGIIQQVATVTISSAVNLLIVGLLLIGFVIMAPNGIVGMVRDFLRVAAPARLDLRAIKLLTIGGYVLSGRSRRRRVRPLGRDGGKEFHPDRPRYFHARSVAGLSGGRLWASEARKLEPASHDSGAGDLDSLVADFYLARSVQLQCHCPYDRGCDRRRCDLAVAGP